MDTERVWVYQSPLQCISHILYVVAEPVAYPAEPEYDISVTIRSEPEDPTIQLEEKFDSHDCPVLVATGPIRHK